MENNLIKEDEICLNNCLVILNKRRKIFLLVLLVSMFVSIIFNQFKPKVYEVTAIVQLGSINGPLIKSEEAKNLILSQNVLSVAIKDLNIELDTKSIKDNIVLRDISGTDLLSITFYFHNSDVAVDLINEIINIVIKHWQELYEKRITIVNDRLNELNLEIGNLEQNISRIQGFVFDSTKTSVIKDPESSLKIVLLQNVLPIYESNLNMLRNQRKDLRVILCDAKEFKVFENPLKTKYLPGPGILKKLTRAIAMSLIFSVLLVFILEMRQKIKKE